VQVPARANSLAQQARFDALVETFNTERLHEALDMRTPAARYTASPRPPRPRPRRRPHRHHRPPWPTSHHLQVFEGQRLRLRGLVSFMHYDPGYIDLEARTLQTIGTPFGSRVSPM
jgi:hypothetical protein